MALTTKKKRSDLLLNTALKDGGGKAITQPTDINIGNPIQDMNRVNALKEVANVNEPTSSATTNTTNNTQGKIAPNAVGVPSEAYAHANGTYEPQLLTPVGETDKSKTEQLVDLANQNYAKEYEDRENANFSNSEGAKNSPSEQEKIDEQLQQGYSDHYEELDDSNKNNVPAIDVETPKVEEPTNANNNSINYDTDDNPYKTKSDQLQAIIDKINADNEAKAKEYEEQLEAQKKAYDDLRNNSIDLLKGNNDEAWKDQKNRINQSALNYKSELDAINQKSSMYYDDYLEMLGLKGSGAGAGLYNDMAVQNANAATKIEANRQNEIENARQANTDRLMALLDEAKKSGITFSDEELKDIVGTYSKDSLAAGTDAEATRWNRFSNLAKAKADEDEFNKLYQTAIVNNADDEALAKLAKLYGKDAKTREMEAAEIVAQNSNSKMSEEDDYNLANDILRVDGLSLTNEGKKAVKEEIEKIYNDSSLSSAQKQVKAQEIISNPDLVYSNAKDIETGITNVKAKLNGKSMSYNESVAPIPASSATEKELANVSGAGDKGNTQHIWVNALIDLAKEGAIPDGTLVNMDVGYGNDDAENIYMYSNGNWFKVNIENPYNKATPYDWKKYNTDTINKNGYVIYHGGKEQELKDITNALRKITSNNSKINDIINKYDED